MSSSDVNSMTSEGGFIPGFYVRREIHCGSRGPILLTGPQMPRSSILIKPSINRYINQTALQLRYRIVRSMANISTPIPQLKLNDGTSIPMLAYGSNSSPTALSHYANNSKPGLPGINPVQGAWTGTPSRV